MLTFPLKQLLRRIYVDDKVRKLSLTSRYFKSDKEDDDLEPKISAADKLQALLQTIVQEGNVEKVPAEQALAKSEVVPRKRKQKILHQKPKELGVKIVESAKDIAKKLGDKPEKTEADLLHRLLQKDTTLKKTVLKAASGNELLKDLLTSMKVEHEKPKRREMKDVKMSRADQVRGALGSEFYASRRRTSKDVSSDERVDLFSGEPFGIFHEEAGPASDPPQVSLPCWDKCNRRELKLLVTHPPTNIYEQMILWTERGILWKLPVDNEQGLEEEKKVYFADHVFLEPHLEDWCPDKGPIRHFMELVCVGLSRNHWLTAEEKKGHILWYRDYFWERRDLIREIGAGEVRHSPQIAAH